jgi:hypothetical protein
MAKRVSSFDRDCMCPKRTRRSKSHPRKVDGLADARALARKYPKTFTVPSEVTLKKLKPGDYVKVARNDERFWLKLDGYVGRRWHGTVANELLKNRNPDLDYGESIFFMRKNIYDAMPRKEMEEAQAALSG